MFLRSLALSALSATSTLVLGAATQKPASAPTLGTDTVHGCYKSFGNLVLNKSDEFNAQGPCARVCRAINKPVAATFSKDCYCGDKYPAPNTLGDDADCTEPCPGFGTEACGGLDRWTVYNTGVRVSVADEANITTTTSSTTGGASTPAPIATGSGSSVPAIPSETSTTKNSGGNNTVGIAVGVVVGVIAIGAIGGLAFFLIKRRKNREIEEEHRRNAAVNAFISGGKPPSSSGGLSISDQRLDPGMVQRRMSSGSIADDQDYSRRILRVTNA